MKLPMRSLVQYLLCSTLNGFGQIFLQRHQGCGLLIALAIGFNDHRLLYGALIGVITANAMARCHGYLRADIESGLYGYNAALLGLMITWLLGFTPSAILLTAALSALSSSLQHLLLGHMRERQGLAGYTLPFVLIGWTVLALCTHADSANVRPLTEHSLNQWSALEGILRGMAQVILLSDPLAGLCVFAGLLVSDRRGACWALCGSAVGIYAALLISAAEADALEGLASYNPALAALALSQVHRSSLAPTLGIVLSIIGGQVFGRFGIPPLTMPFILACWAVTLTMRHSQRQPHLQPAG